MLVKRETPQISEYKVLIHEHSIEKASNYLLQLRNGEVKAGEFLIQSLGSRDLNGVSLEDFLHCLVNTKHTQIFAESSVFGDGTDWNQLELSILGDISISVPVSVYDNALHYFPDVYDSPISATLVYTPGALLENGTDNPPVDWQEVTCEKKINYLAYLNLYERRLLPCLLHIAEDSRSKGKKALITVPGLGCGQFAGKFKGSLGGLLQRVLHDIILKHSSVLGNIRAVYYDPFSECENQRLEINGISLLVRPLLKGNGNRPQLCEPSVYQDEDDDFSDCSLYSLVAWDHVSWPGNDFYIGSRATDDGVKAAATDSMFKLTGVEGEYSINTNTYEPPANFKNWAEVVLDKKLSIVLSGNLNIYTFETFKNY